MSKKIAKKDNIKYALSGGDAFIGAVEPGETFEVECAININDGVITHVGQQLKPDDVHIPFVNGATGPIEVHGAKPGDMLTVEVLDMKVEGIGFSSLWPGIGIFPDWVRHHEFGIKTQAVEVKDGIVHWDDKLKLPVRPMIGVAGVAPLHGAVLTVDNGPHGGNLDVQEITTGNKVMFRARDMNWEGVAAGDTMTGTATENAGKVNKFTGRRFVPIIDVSGHWKINIDGQSGRAPTVAILQKGTELAGTYRGKKELAVTDAKLEGDTFSFKVQTERGAPDRFET